MDHRITQYTLEYFDDVSRIIVILLFPVVLENSGGQSIHSSVVPPPLIAHIPCAQLLLQVLIDLSETLHAFSTWSEDVHAVWK